MPPIEPRLSGLHTTFRMPVRGDIFRLRAPATARGHEQRGRRFAVVLQSDDLPLSTLLVAPTSRSARATLFRPEIDIDGTATRVLVEQTAAVAPERLGAWAGRVTVDEMRDIDEALRLAFALDLA